MSTLLRTQGNREIKREKEMGEKRKGSRVNDHAVNWSEASSSILLDDTFKCQNVVVNDNAFTKTYLV